MSRRLLLAVPVLVAILVLVAAVTALASDRHTSVANAITTLTAVLAVAGAIVSVRVARDLHQKELTLKYVERLNDPKTFEARAELVRWVDLRMPPTRVDREEWNKLARAEQEKEQAAWERLTKAERQEAKLEYLGGLDHAGTLRLFSYANLLEEIGGSMELRLLHKPTVRRHILPVSEPYFSLPLTRSIRKRWDAEIWEYWEAMVRELE